MGRFCARGVLVVAILTFAKIGSAQVEQRDLSQTRKIPTGYVIVEVSINAKLSPECTFGLRKIQLRYRQVDNAESERVLDESIIFVKALNDRIKFAMPVDVANRVELLKEDKQVEFYWKIRESAEKTPDKKSFYPPIPLK